MVDDKGALSLVKLHQVMVTKGFVVRGFTCPRQLIMYSCCRCSKCTRSLMHHKLAHQEHSVVQMFEPCDSGSDFPGNPPEAQEELGGDYQ